MKGKKDVIKEIKAVLGEYVLEYIMYIDSGYDTYKAASMLSQRDDGRYLTGEFYKAFNKIKNGSQFQRSIMGIGDRYYEAGLDSFLRIITRSYIRGNDGAIGNLRILMERILHEEISGMKEKAERANTKLSIPITMIFISVILISVYPALTQFKI